MMSVVAQDVLTSPDVVIVMGGEVVRFPVVKVSQINNAINLAVNGTSFGLYDEADKARANRAMGSLTFSLKNSASNPIPEPNSALLFVAGASVVVSSLRRNRHASAS